MQNKILQTIKELEEASDVDTHSKNSWLSGVYITLADKLKEEDNDEAKTYLKKAKKIIDSDPDLKIRKSQWENVAQKFN